MFVAVPLPPAARAAVAAAAAEWRRDAPPASWVPAENLHVTLRFLGEVPDEQVVAISAAISGSLAHHVDLPVRLGSAGAFPSAARARVLWVGVDDPAGGVAAIEASLGEHLATLGFEPEDRPFRPHVTVARLRAPARVVPADVGVEPVRFTVDRVALIRSVLRGSSPPLYEPVSTHPFRRPLSPPRPDPDP